MKLSPSRKVPPNSWTTPNTATGTSSATTMPGCVRTQTRARRPGPERVGGSGGHRCPGVGSATVMSAVAATCRAGQPSCLVPAHGPPSEVTGGVRVTPGGPTTS